MMRFLRRTFGRGSMRRYQSPGERDRRGRGGIGTLPQPHPHLHQQQLHHVPTVVTGGAVVHIPAAGNSKSVLTCRVLLLDGTDVSVDLPIVIVAIHDTVNCFERMSGITQYAFRSRV
ncbi:UNVERIFIED_CONTAM: hypothetical protein FKN15_046745 [Acipenser sinensis]